jgi:hypothetical protein
MMISSLWSSNSRQDLQIRYALIQITPGADFSRSSFAWTTQDPVQAPKHHQTPPTHPIAAQQRTDPQPSKLLETEHSKKPTSSLRFANYAKIILSPILHIFIESNNSTPRARGLVV